MPTSRTALRSALFAIIAGAIAGLIYEGIYYLANHHHLRAGFGIAALIGALTFLIAFLLNLLFTRGFSKNAETH